MLQVSRRTGSVTIRRPKPQAPSDDPAQDECVEVAPIPDITGVRDTKDRDGGTLVFSSTTWSGFLQQVKTGSYDADSSGASAAG